VNGLPVVSSLSEAFWVTNDEFCEYLTPPPFTFEGINFESSWKRINEKEEERDEIKSE
jgi:hypothetical protein